jgi:two-component system, NarL family, nitrate/nitrite response regulator NarL
MQAAINTKAQSGRLRVVVIDDHPVVIAGLKSFLREDPEVEVVGTAGGVAEAIVRAPRLRPDVFLLIVGGSDVAPTEATRELCDACPGVAVVVLSLDGDAHENAAVTGAGASVLLDRRASRHAVLTALYALRGDDETGPRRVVPDIGSAPPPPSSGSNTLSPREIQVLTLIADGYTNKQIADQLGISVRTVETHRERLMRKLDVQGTASLTKAAIMLGLVKAQG